MIKNQSFFQVTILNISSNQFLYILNPIYILNEIFGGYKLGILIMLCAEYNKIVIG